MVTRRRFRTDVRVFRSFLTNALVATLAAAPSAFAGQHDHLAHDIPSFCSSPTIRSISSGAWSNPLIWSEGRRPGSDDAVEVTPGTVVTYDAASSVALNCVAVNGELTFQTDVNTKLTVGTLIVMPSGQLTIGSEANPVSSGVTAEVVIAGQPIDTVADPEQFGTGIIGLGKVTIHGALRAPGFVRLAQEPRSGQTALALAASVTGWQPNDQLFLPDSRQVNADTPSAREWKSVGAVNDRTIQMPAALSFDHPGARNGAGHLDFLPHVANLTRNVVVRSANPAGLRGHVLFTDRAVVDIRYAAFLGLGRTLIDPLDVTTFDENHQVTHLGTNQIGRYALHLHHVFGQQPLSGGYQAIVVGNVVQDAAKWGIVVHNTHYSLVRDNVVVHTGGAGIVTEDGSESFNVIEQNFAAMAGPFLGTGGLFTLPQDFGHAGGFWFRGPNNYVRDNVAADAGDIGFDLNSYTVLGPVPLPTRPGVDPAVDGQVVTINDIPLREFARNEVYGATRTGLMLWSIGWDDSVDLNTQPTSVVRDFRVWHVDQAGTDGTNQENNMVIFDGYVQRGDADQLFEGYTVSGMLLGTISNVTVRHADIQNVSAGIIAPPLSWQWGAGVTAAGPPVIIADSTIRAYIGMLIRPPMFYELPPGDRLPARTIVIQNVRFVPQQLPNVSDPTLAIMMQFDETLLGSDLIQRDTVEVRAFNGVAGDDFHVYYREQAPTYVIPLDSVMDNIHTVGAPLPGLTNAQAWATYGIAIAGSIAPCSTTRPEIQGFVCIP